MYLDPRKIVDRYLKKIASAEKSRVNNGVMFIQRAIDQDMKRIRNSEAAINFEKLESSYAAEYLKRQLKNKLGFRPRHKSLTKSSSDNSISSLPSSIGKKPSSKSSERVDRSIQVDTFNSLSNNSLISPLTSKNQIRNQKLPKLNRHNFKKEDANSIIDEVDSIESFRISKKYEKNQYYKGSESGKSKDYIRIVKKDKQKAMKDYYKSRVKPDFPPQHSSSKHVETSLRAFSSDKHKSFKDFKIVKLFG